MGVVSFTTSIVFMSLTYGIFIDLKSAIITSWILCAFSFLLLSTVFITIRTIPGIREGYLEGAKQSEKYGSDTTLGNIIKGLILLIFIVTSLVMGHFALSTIMTINIVIASKLSKEENEDDG